MVSRPVIDVTHLPESALDHRSSIWWGNLLLLLIETTMFALLVAGYLYLRGNFTQWPPPEPERSGAAGVPLPALGVPAANLALLALSLAPMLWAARAAWHRRPKNVCRALTLTVACGLGAIALRFREFGALHFRWDDNAYGSITWTILGLHLLHLIVATAELALMLAWILVHGMDKKHARDVRVTAVYWYWIVGTWGLLHVLVFWSPRW
jgi:heme/copper-type cytochrome/quinol oxidase subunit 3